MTSSGPASYSILAHDRLALDNLASRIQETQSELAYLAILDAEGTVLAHNRLEETGAPFPQATGHLIYHQGALTVHDTLRNGESGFDFRVPILFTGQRIGEVALGFDATQLNATRKVARQKIVLIRITSYNVCYTKLLRTFASPYFSRT